MLWNIRKYATLLALCTGLGGLVQAQTINKIAGDGSPGSFGDGGPASAAQLSDPRSIIADRLGNYYIADYGNNSVRKIDAAGIITTIAGTGIPGYAGDGGPAVAAQLRGVRGLALDTAGNLLIADAENHCIRKINAAGIISTIAGTGTASYSGDFGPATAAMMNLPSGIAADKRGNIYIADFNNNAVRHIRPDGNIYIFAGTSGAGYSGDGGPATAAQLNTPARIYIDTSGNVYIDDYGNNRIRKVDATGTITLVAGTGMPAFNGDGGPATAAALNEPVGMAKDDTGNLYIADWKNHRIRKVNPSGIISTIAGNGIPALLGDGGPPLEASFNAPIGVWVAANGHLLIADQVNHAIREIDPLGVVDNSVPGIKKGMPYVTAFPNPGSRLVTITATGCPAGAAITVADMAGRVVFASTTKKASKYTETIDLGTTPAGIYALKVDAGGSSYSQVLELR